jgi:hypothetical protein
VGTNITGNAAALSIGGNAATATTATNVSGGTSNVTSETVSGNLLVGGTTAYGGITSYKGSGYCFASFSTINGADHFLFTNNGTTTGSITRVAGTGVLYNTSSDRRVKENIVDAESASSLIDALQVRQFDWKADGLHQNFGFIAQELVAVAPEAVHQPVNPEEMMGVDYSKLVPMLVKEIQSLRARVAQLENK